MWPTLLPAILLLYLFRVERYLSRQSAKKGAHNIWRHGLGISWFVKESLTLKSLNLEVILLFMCVWPKHPRLRGLNLKIDLKSDALLCKMNVVGLFFLLLFSQPNLILFFVFFLFLLTSNVKIAQFLFISPCPFQLDFISKYICINIFFISRLCQIWWYFQDFVSLKVNHWKQLVLQTLQIWGL